MEMIERVARALAALDFESTDADFKAQHIEAAWRIYVDEARVAIEAMWEPTPEMLSVGNDSTWDPEPGLARMYVGETTLKMAYQTMIGAALK